MDTMILIVGLGVASVQDIKWKKIWLPFLWGFTGILIFFKMMEKHRDYSGLFCALMSIVFFSIMCRATKGQIGTGDVFLFGMTGAGLGWADNFRLIYLTFLLASLMSIIMIVIHKKCGADMTASVWKQEIPLSPVALAAFVLMIFF